MGTARKSTAPTAVLKSLSAKVFDRRQTILQVSVNQDVLRRDFKVTEFLGQKWWTVVSMW